MKILNIALISSALLMPGAVLAKDYPHAKQPAKADQYYGLYQSPVQVLAPSRADRADFDQSGTHGRLGLGASSFHPEGPGNVSD
jgi:hypothetical protein